MVGKASWDTLYPSKAAMIADMQTFKEVLREPQQGTWWKRGDCLLITGDASEYGFGAYTPNGELQHPMVVPCTALQLDLMAANDLSSTERERDHLRIQHS